MTVDRAVRMAEQWANGQVCTLRDGEAEEYHRLCLAALRAHLALTALLQAKDVIVSTDDDREYIDYTCPKCGDIISQRRKGQKKGVYQPKYHDSCGQQLDWTRVEAEAAQQEEGRDD